MEVVRRKYFCKVTWQKKQENFAMDRRKGWLHRLPSGEDLDI